MQKAILTYTVSFFIIALILGLGQKSWAQGDISLEVAQRAKSKVERGADSLKKGLQNFGQKLAEIAPEIYKVKAEIDEYKEAGQWESLPSGEKALLLARSLKSIGRLEKAFSENLPAILRGMETYDKSVGEAIVETTRIKGASKDADYFIKQRVKKIRRDYRRLKADPGIKKAKEILNSPKCKKNEENYSECFDAKMEMHEYKMQVSSLSREAKILKQQKKLTEMNQKLATAIQGRLKKQGPFVSRSFRQVIETWNNLSENMELLRSMPVNSITGKEGIDKTEKISNLASNLTKLGDDFIDVFSNSVDTVVGNLSDISNVSVTGGAQTTENIIDNTEAAEKNLERLLEF